MDSAQVAIAALTWARPREESDGLTPSLTSLGPFLMARTVVDDVLRLPEHLGWGWRHATVVAAHRRGLTIRHITGDDRCPPDQSSEGPDERSHRLRQLSENIQG